MKLGGNVKGVTDSAVKWHEEGGVGANHVHGSAELNRITGDLVKSIVQQGQAFVWNYSCQKAQKLL